MEATRTLVVRLFGDIDLKLAGKKLADFPTRRSSALFARLIDCAGQSFTRDSLVEQYWHDCDPAHGKNRLRTELWRIRRIVEADGLPSQNFLQVEKDRIGFNSAAEYQLDVALFESGIEALLQCSPRELDSAGYLKLQNILALYRGDYLQHFDDDWCILRRESLRAQYLTALECLMLYHKYRENWDQAISCATRLLSGDPLMEHVHVELMTFYWRKGNRPAALKQYYKCRRCLSEELGISPMESTESTYRRILQESPSVCAHAIPSPDSVESPNAAQSMIDQALAQLRSAERLLQSATRKIRQS